MHCQPEKVSDISASAARVCFQHCMQNSQSVYMANRQCRNVVFMFPSVTYALAVSPAAEVVVSLSPAFLLLYPPVIEYTYALSYW